MGWGGYETITKCPLPHFRRSLRSRCRVSSSSSSSREKSCEGNYWANLCEDAAKLTKKSSVLPEVNKYLKTSWTIKTASEEQQE